MSSTATTANSNPEADKHDKLKRLVRRMEHCARAREESTRILSVRFAQRDIVRTELKRQQEDMQHRLSVNQQQRENRWSLKLQNSPYSSDLAAESEQISETQRIRALIENRKKQILLDRQEDAQTSIIQRGLGERDIRDELNTLRKEKRYLVQREKEASAFRAKEKTQAKMARIEADKRNVMLEREQHALQQRLRSGE